MSPRIELRLECECPDICDHAVEKLSEIIQEAFDYGYDEGWTESFKGLREMFIENGLPGAEDLAIPKPPPRTTKRARVESRPKNKKREWSH